MVTNVKTQLTSVDFGLALKDTRTDTKSLHCWSLGSTVTVSYSTVRSVCSTLRSSSLLLSVVQSTERHVEMDSSMA